MIAQSTSLQIGRVCATVLPPLVRQKTDTGWGCNRDKRLSYFKNRPRQREQVNNVKRYKLMAVAAVAGMCLVGGIQPMRADGTATCDSGFGARVPVLLVHGFGSNPKMWSEGGVGSLAYRLQQMQELDISAFDYEAHHFDWVTDRGIGLKLAQTIHCLAQSSRAGGGAGKVIVVTHSMGGLAVREAANRVVGDGRVASDIGLVINIATPNLGSPLATVFGGGLRWYCSFIVGDVPDKGSEISRCLGSAAITGMRQGSKELRALPRLPAGVPVRAIAGDMTLIVRPFPAWPVGIDLDSDVVVDVRSATFGHTDTGMGDGAFVFKCDLRHYRTYSSFNYQGGHANITRCR